MKRMQSRILAFILAAVMALSFMAAPLFATGEEAFEDVPKSAWYHGYVMMLYEKGIVKGYGSTGEYRPDNKLSREHAAKMITLAAGLPYKGKKADFPDVDKEGEMSAYIAALVDKGAVQGFPGGKFKPLDNIQRGHAAKMVALAFGLKEGDMTQALTDLPDDADVKTAIQILESNGVVKGFGGTKLFKPEEEINRAEFAKILCIAMVVKAIENAEDDPSPANIAAAEALLGKLPKGQDGPTQDYLTGRLEGLEEEPVAPGPGGDDPKPEQVSAVTITTDPKDVSELDNYAEVMVTLTTDTPDADIYYTLDGDPPTASSKKYTSSITVRAGTSDATVKTIQAIGVKVGMTDSPVTSKLIEFQKVDVDFDKGITGKLGASYVPTAPPIVVQPFRSYSPFSNGTKDDPINGSVVDEIWAIPIDNYEDFNPTVFRDLKSFDINPDGSFNIDVSELSSAGLGYVFILANSQADIKERIVSFLSMKVDGDFNQVIIPVEDINRVMNLGLINKGTGKSENEGVSAYTVRELSSYFSNDITAYLEGTALVSNFLKVLANYYINDGQIHGEGNEYFYNSSLTHYFYFTSSHVNGGLDLTDHPNPNDLRYSNYEIIVGSDNTEVVDPKMLPSEPVSDPYNDRFDEDNLIPMGTSEDSPDYYSYYSYPRLVPPIPEGFWQFGRETGNGFEVEAEFDFAMHDFIEDHDNYRYRKPLGYIPMVKLNVAEGVIESVNVKWYFNDGNEFTEIQPGDGLNNTIFGLRIQHRSNFYIEDFDKDQPFEVDPNAALPDLLSMIESAYELLNDESSGYLFDAVVDAENFVEDALDMMQEIEYLPSFVLYYKTFGVNYGFIVGNSEANFDLISKLNEAIERHEAVLNEAMVKWRAGEQFGFEVLKPLTGGIEFSIFKYVYENCGLGAAAIDGLELDDFTLYQDGIAIDSEDLVFNTIDPYDHRYVIALGADGSYFDEGFYTLTFERDLFEPLSLDFEVSAYGVFLDADTYDVKTDDEFEVYVLVESTGFDSFYNASLTIDFDPTDVEFQDVVLGAEGVEMSPNEGDDLITKLSIEAKAPSGEKYSLVGGSFKLLTLKFKVKSNIDNDHVVFNIERDEAPKVGRVEGVDPSSAFTGGSILVKLRDEELLTSPTNWHLEGIDCSWEWEINEEVYSIQLSTERSITWLSFDPPYEGSTNIFFHDQTYSCYHEARLQIGDNAFKIEVEAPDGQILRVYEIAIDRLDQLSEQTAIENLSIEASDIDVDGAFDNSQNIEGVCRLSRPYLAFSNPYRAWYKVFINGVRLYSGTEVFFHKDVELDAENGTNSITIELISENKKASAIYNIQVEVVKTPNTELVDWTLALGDMGGEGLEVMPKNPYTIDTDRAYVEYLYFNNPYGADYEITLNGLDYIRGSRADLKKGPNTFRVDVTSSDGGTSTWYEIVVNRTQSIRACITGLFIEGWSSEVENPDPTTEYNFGTGKRSVYLAFKNPFGASYKILNGTQEVNECTYSIFGEVIDLSPGDNQITIEVTSAADSSRKNTYTILISSTWLDDLEVNEPVIWFAGLFDLYKLGDHPDPVETVSDSTACWVKDPNGRLIEITLNEEGYLPGEEIRVDLDGNVVLIITFTNQDNTTESYTINLKRRDPSNLAELEYFSIGDGILESDDNPDVNVPYSAVTYQTGAYLGAVASPGARIVVEKGQERYDEGYWFDLIPGKNELKIIVTAEDGITSNTYNVTITRLLSTSAEIEITDIGDIYSIEVDGPLTGEVSEWDTYRNYTWLFYKNPYGAEVTVTFYNDEFHYDNIYQGEQVDLAVGVNVFEIYSRSTAGGGENETKIITINRQISD